MTEKMNKDLAAAPEAPKKEGVLQHYFRKNRSTKTAAQIAAEIESEIKSQQPQAPEKKAEQSNRSFRPAQQEAPKPQAAAPKDAPAQNRQPSGASAPRKKPEQGGQAPARANQPRRAPKPKSPEQSGAKAPANSGPKAPKPAGNKPAANGGAKQQGAGSKPAATGNAKPAAGNRPSSNGGSNNRNRRKAPAGVNVAMNEQVQKQRQKAAAQQRNHRKNVTEVRYPPLKIISLGGLGEIGKNITVLETENDMIIVDCGSAFPDDDLPGVDLVIPDFTYLVKNAAKIRGIFVTHGHEDHIGGLPYLLKQINVPVYSTALTNGLICGKLKEQGILGQCKMNVVKAGDTIKAGSDFRVEFIRVNHSIPDACALALHTPAGVVIMTGDFKVDFTPISGEPIDLVRFGELGSQGVLALLGDSTNAEKPGSTPSERIVGESFEKLFKRAAKKRIIIATFASNVHRVQQVIDTAVRSNRKVAVFGRSMVNVVNTAIELGYLNVPSGTLVDVDNLKDYTDDQIVLITTGSQGEPMSALTRMSTGAHRNVRISSNDCIIISATPIPGNEKTVGKVVNELMRLGADVIYERMYDVHVSGHACQDETKLLLSLTRPKFFMPVHGEYKHLMKNASVGTSMGIDPKNIIISDIGRIVETDGVDMKLTGIVPSGRVLVDGLGVGDVGSVVLRDRKLLADDGLIVVVLSIDKASGEILAGPDLVSRGFVYVRDNEDLMDDATGIVRNSLDKCKLTGFRDWSAIKGRVRDELGDFIFTRTKRKPVILPIIEEV